jgi:TonB family protein
LVDQSFKALVLSLVIHVLFAWVFQRVPSQFETPLPQPIEISIAESAPKKKQHFVTETQKPELNPIEKLRDQADYLSALTKRVKEQVVARRNGQTKNRSGHAPTEADEARAQGAPGTAADPNVGRELILPGPGPGAKSARGSSPFGRQVVVGESTAGEYIPGVKEGAFTALNTDRFTYYTFFARINEQVRSRWVRNLRMVSQSLSIGELAGLASRERVSEIDIQLNSQGEFVRAVLLRSSGSEGLDAAAIEAFRDAAPFPNVPAEMVENDGLIHLGYAFIVKMQPSHLAGHR